MTLKEELEMLAKDCEEVADEEMRLAGADTTAICAPARAWFSMAHRIRHVAKRVKS